MIVRHGEIELHGNAAGAKLYDTAGEPVTDLTPEELRWLLTTAIPAVLADAGESDNG